MSGDPETRNELFELLKERCSLKTVLRLEKPCPYFGPSRTCSDCSFDWMTVSGEVLKVVKARRASYEQEREKNEELQKNYDVLSEEFSRMRMLLDRIASGFDALVEIKQSMREKDGKEESDGRGTSDGQDQESVQGGDGD